MTKCIALSSIFILAVSSTIRAANYYWDGGTLDIAGDGNTASAGGSGIWNTSIKNWDIGISPQTNWPALANSHQAYFGGSGGTVTFGANMGAVGSYPNSVYVTAGNYVFDEAGFDLAWKGSGLTISGGTLVLTNGTVTMQVNGASFNVTGANALKIYSKVTGTSNLSKNGGGDVYFYNNSNDFTGTLFGQNGSSVYFTSIKNSGVASAVGKGSILATGINNIMTYIGPGDSTDRTLSLFGGGNDTLNNNGTGALIWTGPFGNTKSGASTLTFGGSNTSTNEFRGALTNNGAIVLSVAKIDAGTWILSGANTYSGGTAIWGGTLVFSKTNAMPASGTVANTSGTLGIFLGGAGEFTSGNSGAGTLGGLLAGVGGQGAGVTYSGGVKLSIDTRNAATGQTYMSNIANLGTSLALIKTGAGELALSGTNTYSGATTVSNGVLLIHGLTTNSAMTVGAGGTLGGTGKVGLVMVNAGGAITANGTNTVGTLSATNLTVSENAVIYWNYDATAGTADLINITGSLTLPTNVTVHVSGTGDLPNSGLMFSSTFPLVGASDLIKWSISGPGVNRTTFAVRVGNQVFLKTSSGTIITLQ